MDATICPRCNVELSAPVGSSPTQGAATGTLVSTSPDGSSMMSRYRDAYLHARTVTAFGATVKGLAYLFWGIIVIIGLLASQSYGFLPLLGSVFLGGFLAVPVYVLGVLVSAQGQMVKATLDTAVNSSQLITKDEMRTIMSLN